MLLTIFAVRFDVFTVVLLRIQVCLLGCYTQLLDVEFPIFPRDVIAYFTYEHQELLTQ